MRRAFGIKRRAFGIRRRAFGIRPSGQAPVRARPPLANPRSCREFATALWLTTHVPKIRSLMRHAKPAAVLLLLFFVQTSPDTADAQFRGVPGVRSARRALASYAESPRDVDANAVELRTPGEQVEVFALTEIDFQLSVDLHRSMYSRERRALRTPLCRTPCRLVLNAPVQLLVDGIDLEVEPRAQRQGWTLMPERTELRVLARVAATAGFLGALLGFYFWQRGAAARVDARSGLDVDINADANFRGGIAGFAIGTSLFIAGTTAARLLRGRAVRSY